MSFPRRMIMLCVGGQLVGASLLFLVAAGQLMEPPGVVAASCNQQALV
jgi:hypothetical protein